MSGVVIAETVRRHFTSVGFLSFLALLAIVSVGFAQFDRPAAGWPSLIVLLAIVTGAGPIGPELSSGTLQLILVKPRSRSAYLLSRVAGVVLAVWTAAAVASACELLGRKLESAPEIGAALLNSMIEVVLIVSLLTFLGSVTRAYYNVAIYFGAQIVLALLSGFGRKLPPLVARAVTAVDHNLFPETPPRLEPDWLLLVACNAAVALVLACLAFRRREVPYGAE